MEDADRPFVSVIIPVYNDAANLRLSLDRLRRQTWPMDRKEVIVVDNGSSDDLAAVRAEHPEVVWLAEPKPGSYAARNAAIAQARGQVLAFIDSDCLALPDWMEKGVGRLLGPPAVDIVGGSVRSVARDPARPTWAETYDLVLAFPMEEYVKRDRFAGAGNLFTRRAAFDQVGPFRADLKSGGDREWGNRATGAGLSLVYEPGACVEHATRATVGELWTKRRRVLHGLVQAGLRPAVTGPRKTFVRWALNELVAPVAEFRRLGKAARRPSRTARLKVAAVSTLLRCRAVAEAVRIRRGTAGPAPRR